MHAKQTAAHLARSANVLVTCIPCHKQWWQTHLFKKRPTSNVITHLCTCLMRSCHSRGEVLLLLRNSRHNDNTWGLPGGNVEPGEQLLQVSRGV